MLGSEEQEAVARVIAGGMVAQGREVEAFEKECAEVLGRRHAVAVSSGTAALHLALLAMGVENGERVSIPSYACHALLQAVQMCGAAPVPVDCGDDFQSDVATAPNCKARIAVHLFAAEAPVSDPANTIEDIAQSIGGGTGRKGKVAIASFYATKLFTTGEGGMVFTDEQGIAEEVRDRRDYDHRDDDRQRFAYKVTDMQAAMGRVQLRKLPEFLRRRNEIAAAYHEAFSAYPIHTPLYPLSPRLGGERDGVRGASTAATLGSSPGAPPSPLPSPPQGGVEGHVWFRYVINSDKRDAMQGYLHARGIDAKRPVHCPTHLVLGLDAALFPGAEAAHSRALSLPLYPSLTEQEVQQVTSSVRSFFDTGAAA